MQESENEAFLLLKSMLDILPRPIPDRFLRRGVSYSFAKGQRAILRLKRLEPLLSEHLQASFDAAIKRLPTEIPKDAGESYMYATKASEALHWFIAEVMAIDTDEPMEAAVLLLIQELVCGVADLEWESTRALSNYGKNWGRRDRKSQTT